TCQSDADCPLDEMCSDGACIPRGGGGGGTGDLTLAPRSASVRANAGDPTPSVSFSVGNDGTASLGFDISCNFGTADPAAGSLAAGASATVAVTLPTYFAAGAQSATCTVSTADGTGGPLLFRIAVDVGPDVRPPTVSVAAPAGSLHGTASLAASASDNVGVTSVDFAVDGAVVASASGLPYGVSWDTSRAFNGPHTLTAIAHDAAGNAGTSAPVTVSVGNYPGAALSVHTLLGIPAAATADPANQQHFLSLKHQYALSYDGARRGPNWVSWELNSTWMGSVARQNDFRVDDTFPSGFPQAQLADFSGSGWDRGHMCPSEDRTDVVLDNQNTFYLTNMLPQADNVNGGPWAQLEAYARSLASSGKEVFEVAGGTYTGPAQTIGADAVAVPTATFKLVVVLDRVGQTAADVNSATRVIAVIMPNDNALVAKSADWHTFRVKPADIEAQTGLRLMSDVSEPQRSQLEQQIDTAP
ncbi:MAG TPA: DNA/RNA non-specific endonuclease, partial [Myxococcales bacterium]|nr:DNA/RNA non-specific endonuclease [Myxococcales bacterium]